MADERVPTMSGWDGVVGLEIESATPDEVVGRLEVDPARHMQPLGTLHGGVLCGFLRSVEGGVLRARALPLHRGQTTHVWEVRITDEQDRLVSRGVVRLMILEARS